MRSRPWNEDMRRSRGPAGSLSDANQAVHGSRSEPGVASYREGDLHFLSPDDIASSKRNVAAAYNGNSSYAGYAKADFTQSTINLVTCVLGAGALGYPFCFKECGLVLATFIMFTILAVTRISYQLLLYCAQLSTRRTYEGIAESALGKGGRQLVELCIAAMNLGALVAFLNILADVLSAVAGTIIPPGAEPSRHAYITGVTVLGALPVCLIVRDHAMIAALSNASVVFVVIFAVVVFCTAFAPYVATMFGFHSALSAAAPAAAAAEGASSTAAAAAAVAMPLTPALHMWHVQGVLVSMPVMAYGFTAHQYYMGIYTMLKAPSIRKMKLVTDLALLICACVYWTVGVGGYATFGQRTAGDIIRNLGGTRALGLLGAYARAFKLCYGIAILGNIPLVIMPFYSILKPLLPADEQIKQSTASLASSCTVAGLTRRSSYGGGEAGGFRPAAYKLKTSSGGDDVMRGECNKIRAMGDCEGGSGSGNQQQQLLQPLNAQGEKQQQQQQHLDPHLATQQASYVLTGMQHVLVVFIVLGLGLASALWLPNVELIFGLTGSTASVLVAFIIPAICFIRLYEGAPEVGGGGWESSSSSSSSIVYYCCCCGAGSWLASLLSSWERKHSGSRSSSSFSPAAVADASIQPVHLSPAKGGPVLVVPELRAQWLCRHRLAVLLLVFGIISGLLCTDAILSSISEEKAVVQLAQELVAHEAVVAKASRVQQKAREAAAAVDAVSNAAQQLGSVNDNTNNTLGALTAAAAALDTIATKNRSSGGGDSSHSMWNIKGRIEEHKAKVAEDHVLKNIEAVLSAATADITATIDSVNKVVIKLNASIAQIKADAVAAAILHAASKAEPVHLQQVPAAAAAAATAALLPGQQQQQPGHEVALPVLPGQQSLAAGGIVPPGQASGSTPGITTSSSSRSSNATSAAPGSSSKLAYERANEMARELGKALSTFSHTATSSSSSFAQATAGKSLEQVRDSALSALTALNVTADVLQQVRRAVAAARRSHTRDANVKELMVHAMQRAVNATAASALAMQITGDALSTAASEETHELLSALTRVAHDLEQSAEKSKVRKTTITVTSEGSTDSSSGSAGAAGPTAAAAVTTDAGSSNASASAAPAAAALGAAPGVRPGHPTKTEAEAAAAAAAVKADAAAAAAPGHQQQVPKQPAALEAEAAAAASANAAAHAAATQSGTAAAAAADTVAAGAAAGGGSKQGGGSGDALIAAVVGGDTVADAAVQQYSDAKVADAAGSGAAGSPPAAVVLPGRAPAPDHAPVADASAAAAAAAVLSHADSSHQSALSAEAGQGQQKQIAPAAEVSTTTVETAAAAAAEAAAALSATEAEEIKAVIARIAGVLSSNNATAGPAAGANITALALAIQGAVAWTRGSKAAVLNLIVQDLGKTQPKVAERVLDIVQDISTTEEAAKQQRKAAAAAAAEAGGAAIQQTETHAAGVSETNAGGATPALTVTNPQRKKQQQQFTAAFAVVETSPAGNLSSTAGSSHHTDDVAGPVAIAAPAMATNPVGMLAVHGASNSGQQPHTEAAVQQDVKDVAGPVVAVAADGKLTQRPPAAAATDLSTGLHASDPAKAALGTTTATNQG